MLSLLLLALSLPPAPAPVAHPPVLQEEEADPEFDQRLADAGDDVAKLLELAEWCKENDRRALSRDVFKKVVELAPDNEAARKGLRHHLYDGKWFESYAELSAYRRDEAKRKLEEEGLVRFGDDWVPQEDLPYLRMSWVKDDSGNWTHPAEAAQAAQEATYKADGWVMQTDMVWIAPDEEPEAKWAEGLFKCGDQWLPLEQANEYHASLQQPWTVPGDHFVIESTADWGTAWEAKYYADSTFRDLLRATGLKPAFKPSVLVCANLTQYNTFAAGDQTSGLPGAEFGAFSSAHYSYFAELWMDRSVTPPRYKGGGVSYWDKSDGKTAWVGPFSVRHAAAHSYLQAISPSWETISQVMSNPGQQIQPAAFWQEKSLRMWFWYGLAAYVERYYYDHAAAEEGNPLAIREWALEQLRQKGELIPLDQLFAFPMDPNDLPGAEKLVLQAGMVVAFILDGECEPVRAAHGALKEALRKGEGVSEAFDALQTAVQENQEDLRFFGNF